MKKANNARKQSAGRTSSNGSDFWKQAGVEGSIAHMLSKRPGGMEGALERIKAGTAVGVEPWAALRHELGIHHCAPEDKTDRQIHAFLRSVRPWPDCIPNDEYEDGRAVISLIADSVPADDPGAAPQLELSPQQMADVLYFLHMMYPRDPATWWNEPVGAPDHLIGMHTVLRCIEDNLRRLAGADRVQLRRDALAVLDAEGAMS